MQNQVENRQFSPSRVLCASAKEVSLGWLPALGVKKNGMMGYRVEKEV